MACLLGYFLLPLNLLYSNSESVFSESGLPVRGFPYALYNRLLQNAVEQIKAEAEQKLEERLKAVEADREAKIKVVEDRLTKKFDEEVREVRQAFEESRGANPYHACS